MLLKKENSIIIYEGSSKMNLIKILKRKTYENQYEIFYNDDIIECYFESVILFDFYIYIF
jgi:hypothetical protein